MPHKPLAMVPGVPRLLATVRSPKHAATAADHLAVLGLPTHTTTAVGHQLVVPSLLLAPGATTRSSGRQAVWSTPSCQGCPPAFTNNQVMQRVPCWCTGSTRTRTTVDTRDLPALSTCIHGNPVMCRAMLAHGFGTYVNLCRYTRLRVHKHQEQRRCGCGGALVWAAVWAGYVVCSVHAYGFDLASHLSFERSHQFMRPSSRGWYRADAEAEQRMHTRSLPRVCNEPWAFVGGTCPFSGRPRVIECCRFSPKEAITRCPSADTSTTTTTASIAIDAYLRIVGGGLWVADVPAGGIQGLWRLSFCRMRGIAAVARQPRHPQPWPRVPCVRHRGVQQLPAHPPSPRPHRPQEHPCHAAPTCHPRAPTGLR